MVDDVTEDDIRVFRFNTGEYVVANFVEVEPDRFVIADPLLFQVGPKNEKDQVSVGIQPLIPLAIPGDKCTIHSRDIQLFVDSPADPIIQTFKNATNPIDIPKKDFDLKLV